MGIHTALNAQTMQVPPKAKHERPRLTLLEGGGVENFKLHKNRLCNQKAHSYAFKYCTEKETSLDTKQVLVQKLHRAVNA